MPILNQLSFEKGRSKDRAIIEVRAPLEVKGNPQGGWQLILWVLEAFNYETPFRAMLAEVAYALGQDPEKDLQLPAYEANEDFVEGTLQFGMVPLRVYYEHSLSYLMLTTQDENSLLDTVKRIHSRVISV
jgi:hypothetical protein